MTTTRLEELRTKLRAERISYSELAELQSLAHEIEPGDVELLEAAGVPEFPEEGLRTGTLTIQLDGNPAEDTLRYIADLIEQGMTSGYYPTWEVSE
jgi:hypothetical protein